MFTEKEYKEAKLIVELYESKQLNISDVMPSLLPCREVGCQNPHERAYRGCDLCKFKKQ